MFAFRDSSGPVDLVFTDRLGGVSSEPFDALDLALLPTGSAERDAAVAVNWDRVQAEFAPEGERVDMRQVHGADVRFVDAAPVEVPVCDALVTTARGLTLAVRVADCVPVLLADRAGVVIAAAHVGRQGLVAEILPATVTRMRDAGADQVTAWVGPHVCGACYEVPADLQADVEAVVPGTSSTTSWGTPALDLGAGVASQLARAGVEDVRSAGVCTRESAQHFSYRRDGDQSGRQVGLIRIARAA